MSLKLCIWRHKNRLENSNGAREVGVENRSVGSSIMGARQGLVSTERDGYFVRVSSLSVCPEVGGQHGSKALGLDRHHGTGQFRQQTLDGAAG